MPTFNYRGRAIFFIDEGEGAPLVFLPNAGGTHENWRYQIERFSAHRRVIALDLAGYGRSEGADLPQTQRLHGECLLALMHSLQLKEVDLCAHCVGAAAAVYAASQHPPIRRLALFSPACKDSLSRSVMWPLIKMGPLPGVLSLSRRLLARSQRHPLGRQAWTQLQLGQSPTADFAYVRAPNVSVLEDLARQISRYELLTVKQPVALFWGTKNRVLPIAGLPHAERALRPTRVHQIQGAGHLVMRERPDRVNRLLLSFFSE